MSERRARGAGADRRAQGGLVRQSVLASVAAGAAIASGLALDVSIASSFGASGAADAFFVGARVPLGLLAIVTVAANQALVPVFAAARAREGERHADRLASLVLAASVVACATVAAAVGLAARPLVGLTAPGLAAGDLEVAASVTRAMTLTIPLVTMAEILRAVLNARYAFVAPAAMRVVLNGVAAPLVLLFAVGDVRVVAWSYVAGATAQLTFVGAVAFRRGVRPVPTLAFADTGLRSTARVSLAPLAGAGLNPVARIGEQFVVSFLPPGSISVLNYAYRLISAIGGSVFFRSVVVAVLPRLTEATAAGDRDDVERTTLAGVRMMVLMAVPLTAFMALLAQPAVGVLFRRGSFTADDTALLGAVFAVYAASLVGSGVQRALLAPFFARLDTRTPLRNTAYGVLANLSLLLVIVVPLRDRPEAAVLGVALSYVLAQYVNVAHAAARARRIGLRLAGIWRWTARVAAATASSAAVLVAGRVLDPVGAASRVERLGHVSLVAAAALAVLVAALVASGTARPERIAPQTLGARTTPGWMASRAGPS